MAPTRPASTKPSGQARDDTAAQASGQAAAVMGAAETLVLIAIAAAVGKVLAGMPPQLAARQLRASMVADMTRARAAMNAILASATADARADVQRVIDADLGDLARILPHRPLPALARLAGDLRTAEHTAAAAAMATLAAILAAALAASTVTGRLTEAQRLLDDLAATGLHAHTDRAGRKWGLGNYASAATAGAVAAAHLAMQVAGYEDAGVDLILVTRDDPGPPCPNCRPYVWKLLSLSGHHAGPVTITDAAGREQSLHVSGTLADAQAHGLFHPRCKDSARPWADGADITAAVPPGPGAAREYQARYQAEQAQRRRDRALRVAGRQQAMALTPQARTRARRKAAALKTTR